MVPFKCSFNLEKFYNATGLVTAALWKSNKYPSLENWFNNIWDIFVKEKNLDLQSASDPNQYVPNFFI